MEPAEFIPWASRFPDALLLADGAGTILACNDVFAELTRRLPAAWTGRSLHEWLPAEPERVQAALNLWRGSGRMIIGPAAFDLEGVGPLLCEGALLRRARVPADARLVIRAKPKVAAAGRFLRVNREIEELHGEIRQRRNSEAALARQREWLHVTLSSIGDAVIATDVDGRIEFLNSVAEELTGWTRAEALGKGIAEVFDILDERTRQPGASPVHRALHERTTVTIGSHTILRARSGVERPIEDSAAPIRSADGEVIGAVVVFHDVTRQHEARAAVERARDEALAASRAKDDFLAALSHELRTPLNPALLLASQSSANTQLPEEVRADFATIEKHILLEARLIDDLLDITKIAHGKLSLAVAPVDLAGIICDSLDTVQTDISRKKLKVTLRLNAPNHWVQGDRTRLQQVIWNVLNNAVKFTPPGGCLSIVTRAASPNEVEMEITDTGAGITESELAKLFVPFSQGDHGKNGAHRFGGLGLGLAISRVIVEMHHGRIEARSLGRSQGATITMVLPTLAPERVAPPAAAKGAGRDAGAGHDGRGRGLLLVEDHEATRRTTARLLRARNYDVATAASVAEALEVAATRTFDLVLSDIGLPDGDGLTLMRALAERHQLRGIALSGYGTEQDRARSEESGFVAHLIKPITVHAMEEVLTEFWTKVETAR